MHKNMNEIKLWISVKLYKLFCWVNGRDYKHIWVEATNPDDIEAKHMAEILTDLIKWTLKKY